jgi:hypothetical protein
MPAKDRRVNERLLGGGQEALQLVTHDRSGADSVAEDRFAGQQQEARRVGAIHDRLALHPGGDQLFRASDFCPDRSTSRAYASVWRSPETSSASYLRIDTASDSSVR